MMDWRSGPRIGWLTVELTLCLLLTLEIIAVGNLGNRFIRYGPTLERDLGSLASAHRLIGINPFK